MEQVHAHLEKVSQMAKASQTPKGPPQVYEPGTSAAPLQKSHTCSRWLESSQTPRQPSASHIASHVSGEQAGYMAS